MRPKWVFMTEAERCLFVVQIITSAGIVISSLLQVLAIWPYGNYVSVPLMGVMMIINAIQNWKYHRIASVVCILSAAFCFACAVYACFL